MTSIFANMSQDTLVDVYNYRRKMGQCTYGQCMNKSPGKSAKALVPVRSTKDDDHDGLCEKHTKEIVNHRIFTRDNFERYIAIHQERSSGTKRNLWSDNDYDPLVWLEKILIYQGDEERLAVFRSYYVAKLEHLEVDCLCYEDDGVCFFDIPEYEHPFDLFFDWLDRMKSRC